MPGRRSIFILACFFISHPGFASKDKGSKPFSEAFVSVGTNGQKNPLGTLENFRKLAPGSSMLMANLNTHYSLSEQSDGNLYLFGLGYKSKRNLNGPVFRFALGFGHGLLMKGEHHGVKYFRIDTLTSTRTGDKIYIDSAVYENYKFSHRADLSVLDISVIWRTVQKHKMKLFAGIGGIAGFGSGITTLKYHNYSIINYYPQFRYNDNVNRTEKHEQMNYGMLSLYCPLGVDYQLSKKSTWEKLHLFIESRAQVYYRNIPELGKSIQGRLQISFGVRVRYD